MQEWQQHSMQFLFSNISPRCNLNEAKRKKKNLLKFKICLKEHNKEEKMSLQFDNEV